MSFVCYCIVLYCIEGGSKYIYCVSHLFTDSCSRRILVSGVACVKEYRGLTRRLAEGGTSWSRAVGDSG